MTKTLLRAGALTCALLTSTALTAPAMAQSTSDIPPPVRSQVDENGVDLARGEHLLNVTDLSIGPQGLGGLAYVRQLRRTGGGNPYDMGLFQNGSSWTASVGLNSYAFTKAGTVFTSSDGSGATLVQNGTAYSLTTPEGAVVIYDYNESATTDTNRVSRATSISFPTGEQVSLAWVMAQWCTIADPDCIGGEWITAVRLQSVSNTLGYRLHFTYARGSAFNPSHGADWQRLVSIAAINTLVDACDPFAGSCVTTQNWPTVAYSGSAVTDPEGRVSSYTSDATSFRVRRPGSVSDDVVYNYGTGGKIASVVRDGLTWTYAYSLSSNIATMVVTDPGNHTRTIVSDTNVGLPTSVTNEAGRTTSYSHDTAGRLSRITADEDNYVQLSYDARGNVNQTEAVAKPGSGSATITTSAAFPATCANPRTCNQPSSTTDAEGNTTDYSYDATHGGVLTVTAPAPAAGAVRPQTRYTYSSLATPGAANVHRLTNVSACQTLASCNNAADEAETIIAYNHGNLLASAVTRRDGSATLSATTALGYDHVGNLLTVDGPLAGTADTSRARYNLAREVTGTISPDPDGAGALEPRSQRITRGATTGLVTRIEVGTVNSQSEADWATFARLEQVDIAYDSQQRPIRQNLSGSDGVVRAQTQLNYDGEGRPLCTAVRMNTAQFATPLADACALQPAGSLGPDRITRSSYDAANRPILVETGVGTTAAANEVATAYTANGRVFHVTDGNGNRTTYEYDGHDRLRNTRFPSPTTDGVSAPTSGTGADFEQLGYDAVGNVTAFRNRSAQTIALTYDALNRPILKNLPGSEPDVAYTYDLLDRMTGASQTGHALTFSYDALGRKLTETGPHGTIDSDWDLAGRRIRITHPDGFFVDQDHLVTGEMTRIRENGATTGAGVLATIAYDDLGRRTSLTRGNGTVTGYGYDAVSRLTSLTQNLTGTAHDLTLGFSHNPAGQITSNTRSNDAYAFTGHANVSQTDSHDGLNRIATGGVTYDSRGNMTSDGVRTFSYSSENLLTGATGTPISPVVIGYDPMMRLYSTNGWGGFRFIYDGANLLAEYDAAGTFQRRHVFAPGVDEPLASYDGAGTAGRRYYHADERGSVIARSDGEANGVTLDTTGYDEYGASNLTYRFRFTGQMWVPELGPALVHYRARFYHNNEGRFLQPDPIGYGSGMNLYAYVRNDPVNLADPSGLASDDPIMVIAKRMRTDYSKLVGIDQNRMETSNDIRNATNSLDRAAESGTEGGSEGQDDCQARPDDPNCNIEILGQEPIQLALNCVDGDPLCDVRRQYSVEGVGTALGRGLRDRAERGANYVRNCVGGLPSVNQSQVGVDASRGALRGSAFGAARGLVLGSIMGPAGSGWAATGGAVTGTLGGGLTGAVQSVVSQACRAGNAE